MIEIRSQFEILAAVNEFVIEFENESNYWSLNWFWVVLLNSLMKKEKIVKKTEHNWGVVSGRGAGIIGKKT